jgi:hyperosmotically inducible protein
MAWKSHFPPTVASITLGGWKMRSLLKRLVVPGLVAVLMLGCAGSATKTSTGEYIDDTVIEAKVKTKLLEDKQTSGLAINVETYKGTVQLSGFAKSQAEKERAGEVAKSVAGVQKVINNIALKSAQ